MPASGRSGRDEYLEAHIPGARFLDIDEVADQSNPAPHMLPTPRSSARRWTSSASAATTASSSTTIRRPATRLAAGSCFVISAPIRSQSSTVASRNGCAEGRPTESGEPQPAERGSMRRSAAARSSPRQDILAGLERRCSTRAAEPASKAARPTRAPALRRAIFRAPATCPFGALYRDDGTFKSPEEIETPLRRSGRRPGEAVRRELRFGRHCQQHDLCRIPSRQRCDAALRRKLERMGRRSGDARKRWVRPSPG